MDHSGDHSRRSAPRNQPQLRQPLQMLRYAYSERPRQHTPSPHRQVGSLESPRSPDARYYSKAQMTQSADRERNSMSTPPARAGGDRRAERGQDAAAWAAPADRRRVKESPGRAGALG